MIQLRPGQSKTVRLRWWQDRSKTLPLNAAGGSMSLFGPPPDLTINFTPVDVISGEFDMRISGTAGKKPRSLHNFAIQLIPAVGDPLVPPQDISVMIL